MEEKNMTTKKPIAIRVTRYLAGPALALGVALGSAAVANALPEWDSGMYDRCIARIPIDVYAGEHGNDAVHECCLKSGGQWQTGDTKCVAPPAESQGRNPVPRRLPTPILAPEPLPVQGPVIAPAPGGVA